MVKEYGEIWIGYTGTLGISYDLPMVFEALRQLDRDGIRFIVVGDGPRKSEFEDSSKGLNVTFLGRLPYEKMCGVLTACDIVVNPIVGKSVASIINKHADYAAFGKPVLNTQRCEEYRDLIKEYQMGINCDGSKNLAESIERLICNLKLRLIMGNNARRCAKDRFDRKVTYKALENIIRQRK